jgi:hypothetical protein
MPFLATLKQSLAMTSTHGASSKSQNNEHHNANITQLPDEIFEMIVNKLDRTTDITNLRQSNKRLALLTTHLIAARCPPDRNCLNATESLKILTTGSRIPLLNGTITSLTLSARQPGKPQTPLQPTAPAYEKSTSCASRLYASPPCASPTPAISYTSSQPTHQPSETSTSATFTP